MGIKVVETSPGNLSITCDCGKPITKSTIDFGMDCEDDCNRKEAIAAGYNLDDIINEIEKLWDDLDK